MLKVKHKSPSSLILPDYEKHVKVDVQEALNLFAEGDEKTAYDGICMNTHIPHILNCSSLQLDHLVDG